jgi:hypothetical protein
MLPSSSDTSAVNARLLLPLFDDFRQANVKKAGIG